MFYVNFSTNDGCNLSDTYHMTARLLHADDLSTRSPEPYSSAPTGYALQTLCVTHAFQGLSFNYSSLKSFASSCDGGMT